MCCIVVLYAFGRIIRSQFAGQSTSVFQTFIRFVFTCLISFHSFIMLTPCWKNASPVHLNAMPNAMGTKTVLVPAAIRDKEPSQPQPKKVWLDINLLWEAEGFVCRMIKDILKTQICHSNVFWWYTDKLIFQFFSVLKPWNIETQSSRAQLSGHCLLTELHCNGNSDQTFPFKREQMIKLIN